jgi:hypothetical protein
MHYRNNTGRIQDVKNRQGRHVHKASSNIKAAENMEQASTNHWEPQENHNPEHQNKQLRQALC